MNRWTRYAPAAALLALLAGLTMHRQAFAPHTRPAPPNPADAEARAAVRAILARTAKKRQAAEGLIAGRLTLLQAAAAFRDLDAQGPPTPSPLGVFPDSESEDEAYCRSVLGYVKEEAPADRVGDLVRRLDDEIDALRRDGKLRLPAPQDAGALAARAAPLD